MRASLRPQTWPMTTRSSNEPKFSRTYLQHVDTHQVCAGKSAQESLRLSLHVWTGLNCNFLYYKRCICIKYFQQTFVVALLWISWLIIRHLLINIKSLLNLLLLIIRRPESLATSHTATTGSSTLQLACERSNQRLPPDVQDCAFKS